MFLECVLWGMKESVWSAVAWVCGVIDDHKLLQLVLRGLYYLAVGPFYVVLFVVFVVGVVVVGGWGLYGVLVWMYGFMWVFSGVFEFSLYVDTPPLVFLALSVCAAVVGHLGSIWAVWRWWDSKTGLDDLAR